MCNYDKNVINHNSIPLDRAIKNGCSCQKSDNLFTQIIESRKEIVAIKEWQIFIIF